MTHRTITTLALAAALFVPATGFAKTETQTAPNVDFTTFQTFSWQTEDPNIPEPIHTAITEELEAIGLQAVEEGGDLMVSLDLAAIEETRVHVTELDPRFYGRRWSRRIWPLDVTLVETYEVTSGTLEIEMSDAEGHVVWSGTAEGRVRRSPSKNAKKTAKTMGKMLRDFPSAP